MSYLAISSKNAGLRSLEGKILILLWLDIALPLRLWMPLPLRVDWPLLLGFRDAIFAALGRSFPLGVKRILPLTKNTCQIWGTNISSFIEVFPQSPFNLT